MILDLVFYGHPALRTKGSRIEKVTEDIVQLAEDMLETMYENDGVGLAAQQIGRPLQMCVVDVEGVKDRPSAMRIEGREVEVDEHMPMILLNPEIAPLSKEREGAEGCLSFPGVRGDITRPFSVAVKALMLDGSTMEFEADGLLARAIQHEHDHLHGILFIDRMKPEDRKAAEADIEKVRTLNA